MTVKLPSLALAKVPAPARGQRGVSHAKRRTSCKVLPPLADVTGRQPTSEHNVDSSCFGKGGRSKARSHRRNSQLRASRDDYALNAAPADADNEAHELGKQGKEYRVRASQTEDMFAQIMSVMSDRDYASDDYVLGESVSDASGESPTGATKTAKMMALVSAPNTEVGLANVHGEIQDSRQRENLATRLQVLQKAKLIHDLIKLTSDDAVRAYATATRDEEGVRKKSHRMRSKRRAIIVKRLGFPHNINAETRSHNGSRAPSLSPSGAGSPVKNTTARDSSQRQEEHLTRARAASEDSAVVKERAARKRPLAKRSVSMPLTATIAEESTWAPTGCISVPMPEVEDSEQKRDRASSQPVDGNSDGCQQQVDANQHARFSFTQADPSQTARSVDSTSSLCSAGSGGRSCRWPRSSRRCRQRRRRACRTRQPGSSSAEAKPAQASEDRGNRDDDVGVPNAVAIGETDGPRSCSRAAGVSAKETASNEQRPPVPTVTAGSTSPEVFESKRKAAKRRHRLEVAEIRQSQNRHAAALARVAIKLDTRKRRLMGIAESLGLEDEDWDAEKNVYSVTVQSLTDMANAKIFRAQNRAATMIQRTWRQWHKKRYCTTPDVDMATAAIAIQRWLRQYMYTREPLDKNVSRSARGSVQAAKLQSRERGGLSAPVEAPVPEPVMVPAPPPGRPSRHQAARPRPKPGRHAV